MNTASTITLERPTPQRATITFTNPPVNLVVAETVVRMHEIVSDLTDDPDIQVVVFKSGLPDFFINHFDLAAAADRPAAEDENAVPIWTDPVLRLSRAPFITIASIRGRTRGGGGGGGTERPPRFLGRDRALEVILTSSDSDADTPATTSSCAPPDPPTQQSHIETSRKLWLGFGNSRQ